MKTARCHLDFDTSYWGCFRGCAISSSFGASF